MDDGRLPPKVSYQLIMDMMDTAAVFGFDTFFNASRDSQILMVAHQQTRKALAAMIQEDTKPIPKKK